MTATTLQIPIQDYTNEMKVAANMRQLSRISYKKRQANEIADAIELFFNDNGIPLAKFRKNKSKAQYQDKVKDYLEVKKLREEERELYDLEKEKLEELGFDVSDMKIKEIKQRTSEAIEAYTQYPEYVELSKAYFILRGGNKSIVQKFVNTKGETGVQLLAHWYSRHKLCPVWNMRKSQIIRKKYRDFLGTYTIFNQKTCSQELLIKTHTPVHMVLTLPHANGEFEGQRFYARKLLKYFHEMRRAKFFKSWIFGGEYGLEIKKSKAANGLHIHLHSFCFLKNEMSVNNFRAWLSEKWQKLTGAIFCHFETLYFYKRDSNGQWIMEPRRVKSKYGWEVDYEREYKIDKLGEVRTLVPKFVRKKHYINSDSTIEEYTAGVMECIKYHFKMDDYQLKKGDPDEDGVMVEADTWDVPLMMDILNNSVGLRFYSRYGGFLKIQELNFNAPATPEAISEEEESENIDDENSSEENQIEETIMSSTDGVLERSINPFTMLPANDDEYTICVVAPDKLHFHKQDGRLGIMHAHATEFIEVDKSLDLKQIIRAVCTNKLHEICTPDQAFSKN